MKNQIDPSSRNYSLKDVDDDPRMVRTTKEMFITMGVYIVYGALMIINLFTLGRHSADYPKILGFPLWIFVLICLLIAMVVTVELICTYVYKDMPLTDEVPVSETDISKNTGKEEK